MWLTKPVYEALPYVYLIAGAVLLTLSMYLDFGIWPTTCLVLGIACLVYGLVLWLRRRVYRGRRSGADEELL
ncbi:MAG: hypothetical protein AAGA84_08705 [Pseudomonadota bacterium]